MKNDIRKKDFDIKEEVAYYILGYEKYIQTNDNNNDEFIQIIKCILEVAKDDMDSQKTKDINNKYLNRINFSWKMSADEFIAYAICIFYVLTQRAERITDERVVKQFLSEIHLHSPRRILKEADFIINSLFPDLNDN